MPRSAPEVTGGKSVRVAKAAHCDDLGGPWSDAGQFQQLHTRTIPVASCVEHHIPLGQRRDQRDQRPLAGLRKRQVRRVDLSEILDRGEHMREAAICVGDGLTVGGHETGGVGACGLDGHLLTEHDPQCQLLLVDGPRNSLPRRLGDQRTEVRIGAERVDDRLRIRVQVEQTPASCYRRGEIPKVVQPDLALHMVGLWCETDDSVAIRQSQRPPVAARTHLLDARNRARRQVAEQALVCERHAHR